MVEVDPVAPADRAPWERLARAYKDFYRTSVSDQSYEQTWQRLMRGEQLHGLVARIDGEVVGLAHYLFHVNFWSVGGACYLQDLYVDSAARGRGAARTLIGRVAQAARERGVDRLYWTTQQDNHPARALYDTLAEFRGFIAYDHPLTDPAG